MLTEFIWRSKRPVTSQPLRVSRCRQVEGNQKRSGRHRIFIASAQIVIPPPQKGFTRISPNVNVEVIN